MNEKIACTGKRSILGLCLGVLLGASVAAVHAESTWYVPMIDSEVGGFDHIQLRMADGFRFASPALTAFSGPDALGNPAPNAELWQQSFLNYNRNFAIADGPSTGYEYLAFAVWVDGDRLVDRPMFHYQTFLNDTLVGNWDVVCTGAGELDWSITAGTWTNTRRFPAWLLGDMNIDTVVNNQDIAPFVLALTNLEIWQSLYPNVDILEVGDINGDQIFDNQDIAPFVTLLTGTGSSLALGELGGYAVPEPAGITLLAIGGLAVLLGRSRRSADHRRQAR